MEALKLLFGTDIGLLSLGTIAFIIAMGFWLKRFFDRKIAEERDEQ